MNEEKIIKRWEISDIKSVLSFLKILKILWIIYWVSFTIICIGIIVVLTAPPTNIKPNQNLDTDLIIPSIQTLFGSSLIMFFGTTLFFTHIVFFSTGIICLIQLSVIDKKYSKRFKGVGGILLIIGLIFLIVALFGIIILSKELKNSLQKLENEDLIVVTSKFEEF